MNATEKQLEYLRTLLEQSGDSEMSLYEEYDVTELEAMTVEQASQAIDDLRVILDIESTEETS